MNYTLNQIQIFLKIVQTKSITRAAEELNLTQPAVSIQLRNFQEQFDIPLTEIVGRKIYITEFGHEIAEAANSIVEQVNAINYKTMAYKGQLSGKLKISVVSTGKYIMPFFLTAFLSEHTGVDLLMDVTNRNLVLRSLENNEIDFALVSILPTSLNFEKIDLLQNKLYLVGQTSARTFGPLKEDNIFENLPMIFREKGSGTRQTMEQYIAKRDIKVRKSMELTSNEAVKQAVIAGLGCSIMPLIGIKNELHNGEIQIIPAAGLPIETTWSLIWLKGKKHTPISAALLDYLGKEKQNIVQDKFSWYRQY
jgi:DNA-binding transcriptional LysR family regulator